MLERWRYTDWVQGVCRVIWRWGWLLGMVCVAGTGLALWSESWPQAPWFFALSGHFRGQFLLGSVASLAALGISRLWLPPRPGRWRGRLGLAALLLVIVNNAWVLWPLIWGGTAALRSSDESVLAQGSALKWVQANVLASNQNTQAFVDWLEQMSPDVVAVQEVSPRWGRVLEGLSQRYPYRLVVPREDNFGIALLSRWPARLRVRYAPDSGLPWISARLNWRGRMLTVVATHPPPPISVSYARWRNAHLESLAKFSKALGDEPLVISGDLNITPWAPPLRRLERDSGLRNARLDLARRSWGEAWLGTWPSVLGGWGLPIDHVLVSRHWEVVRGRLGPDLGSDHRALRVNLYFTRPSG